VKEPSGRFRSSRTDASESKAAEGVSNAGERGKAMEEQPQPVPPAATAQKAAEKLPGNGADQADVGNDPAAINGTQKSNGAKPEIGAESRATGAGDNAANGIKGKGAIGTNGLKDDVRKEKEVSADGAGASEKAAKPKYKKRKMALFFAYIGAGYQGMQRNPGAKTIEGELEQALFKAGAITKENFGDPKKVSGSSCSGVDGGATKCAVGFGRRDLHKLIRATVAGFQQEAPGFNLNSARILRLCAILPDIFGRRKM
jgi:hypothetical protein